jgi:hypothetical protein
MLIYYEKNITEAVSRMIDRRKVNTFANKIRRVRTVHKDGGYYR